MARVLLVEDDPILGKGLKVSLELDGYELSWVTTLREAREAIRKAVPDLIVLDLNLPDGSGLSLARDCQTAHPALPLLMLTASADEDSVVAGFEAGASDYVRKPFGGKELKMRILAILKDKAKKAPRALQFNGVKVNPEKQTVTLDDKTLELQRREFEIFSHFVANAENVVTRESLMRAMDKEGEIFDRTIDSHISHLRARLKKAGIDAVKIAPVYGVGYRLEKIE